MSLSKIILESLALPGKKEIINTNFRIQNTDITCTFLPSKAAVQAAFSSTNLRRLYSHIGPLMYLSRRKESEKRGSSLVSYLSPLPQFLSLCHIILCWVLLPGIFPELSLGHPQPLQLRSTKYPSSSAPFCVASFCCPLAMESLSFPECLSWLWHIDTASMLYSIASFPFTEPLLRSIIASFAFVMAFMGSHIWSSNTTWLAPLLLVGFFQMSDLFFVSRDTHFWQTYQRFYSLHQP